MKKLWLIPFTLLLTTLIFPVVNASSPIQITNVNELQNMKNDLTGNYILMNDIDASDTVNWNEGKGFEPIGGLVGGQWVKFRGNFDGNGKKIIGLYINRPSDTGVGLFGHVDTSINDVGLIDVDITGKNFVGALWGNGYSCSVSNSYSTGSVTGIESVGGLVGNVFHGTISKSYSTANVNGDTFVGGLAGHTCDGDVTNSYSTGDVNGDSMVGGLLGQAYCWSNTLNSYSTGSVTGNFYVGGLVGRNYEATITNSYWDILTSGQTDGDGEGKTTVEMLQRSTYVGWDFVTVWAIYEGVTYPYETWQTENYPVPPVSARAHAIVELEDAKNGDEKFDKKLDKAIEHIEKSLEAKLWVDDYHIDPKHGNKVFDEEKKAVKELMHLMKDKHAPDSVKDVSKAVIYKLIEADSLLAHTAYDEAQEHAGDPKVDKELEKCDKEFEKAQNELDHTKKDGTPDPKYDKAIDHYKKAWKHAQHALKHAP